MKWDRNFLFTVISVVFCVNLVMTNVLASKIIQVPFFPSIPISATTLFYPITFLITDIVAEIWGRREANRIVYLGFGASLLMWFLIKVVMSIEPHNAWISPNNPWGYETILEYKNAFSSIFSVSSYLLLGSMIAYLTAQLTDIRIFEFLKQATSGRHLWLRNNLSTMTSQAIDTTIVNYFFLYLGLGLSVDTCLLISLADYSVKVVIALFDTPFCYLGVWLLQKLTK